jgi:DNA recombination protein RmuC
MVSLRTVENIWKTDRQNQNALAIAKQAGSLYDKFVGFINDMDAIGLKLNQTQRVFESSYSKLKTGNGNLIGKAENIRKLGARASKRLPKDLTSETPESLE